MSPTLEIGEFAGHACSLGVPEDAAEELGKRLVEYPQLSVPYHLAMEIGLTKSLTHGMIARKFMSRSVGLFTGAATAAVAVTICENYDMSKTYTSLVLSSCLVGPILSLRFLGSSDLNHYMQLYALSGMSCVTLLGLAASRWS